MPILVPRWSCLALHVIQVDPFSAGAGVDSDGGDVGDTHRLPPVLAPGRCDVAAIELQRSTARQG